MSLHKELTVNPLSSAQIAQECTKEWAKYLLYCTLKHGPPTALCSVWAAKNFAFSRSSYFPIRPPTIQWQRSCWFHVLRRRYDTPFGEPVVAFAPPPKKAERDNGESLSPTVFRCS